MHLLLCHTAHFRNIFFCQEMRKCLCLGKTIHTKAKYSAQHCENSSWFYNIFSFLNINKTQKIKQKEKNVKKLMSELKKNPHNKYPSDRL